MSDSGPALGARESDAARRLARLFRIERSGGLDRRPPAIAAKLIERRAVLVRSLVAIDPDLRRVGAAPSPALDRALAELAGEVTLSRGWVAVRLQQIGKDLRLSRGEGLPSGIRDRIGGRPLGKS